ncbi:MAG: hypothetical protein M1831_003765 [Alyxoria varia]|nr:MAG: hypothetical protein M1831_003765 [Alyxoria varia]
MGKWDPAHDYYADLELSPEASTEEIKKRYRKLALQFHPDRNPGRESECSTRFQAIGQAHDILSDPDQRRGYDQSRRRGNVHSANFAKPNPPRRQNPFPSGAPSFPPPPRRNDPYRTGNPPNQGVPPTAANGGAARYARFANPPPPTPKASTAHPDPNVNKNIYTAWQQMNNPQKGQQPPRNQQSYAHVVPPPYQGPRFKPGTTAPEQPDFHRARSSADVPRSAYEETRARPPPPPRRMSTKPPQRKGVFDPKHEDADEGQAPGSQAYASGSRYERPNLPPRMQANQQFTPQPPPRGQAPTAIRPEPPHSRSRSDDVPFAEGSRERTPFMSHPNEKTSIYDKDSLRRSNSVKDAANSQGYFPPTGPGDSSHARSRSHGSGSQTQDARPSNKPSNRSGPTFIVHDDSSDDDDDMTETSESESEDEPSESDFSNRKKAYPSEMWSRRGKGASPLGKSKSLEEQNARKAQEANAAMFSRPDRHDPFQRSSNPDMRSPYRNERNESGSDLRRDHSYSSMATESSGRPSTHEGTTNHGSQRTRASSRPQQPSPLNFSVEQEADMPQNSSNLFDQRVPTQNGGTFSAEEWARNLQSDNLSSNLAQPPDPATTPNGKNAANIKKPRQQSAPEINLRGSDASASTQNGSGRQSDIFEGDEGASSLGGPVDPMDIDSTPDTTDKASSIRRDNAESTISPKTVSFEPQKPEWRSGPTQNGQTSRTRTEGTQTSQSNPSINISMNDFSQTAPFTNQTTGGIGSLGDLSSNLPFESKASTKPPFKDETPTDGIESKLPGAPLRPVLQCLQSLNKANWQKDLLHFTQYIHEWNNYNCMVSGYFSHQASACLEMEQGPSCGAVAGFLGAVGETEKLKGWHSYMDSFHQQGHIRQDWNSACDQHYQALEEFSRVRDNVMHSGIL